MFKILILGFIIGIAFSILLRILTIKIYTTTIRYKNKIISDLLSEIERMGSEKS